MAQLGAALSRAGLNDVNTYIQSGNVIATTNLSQKKLERLVHDVIHADFGGDIAVLARTPNQFSGILEQNPFADADVTKLYFTLLAAPPDNSLLDSFLANDFTPDRIRYANNVIYTLYATKHSESRFHNNYFERKLKVSATTRNFNTMTRLYTMVAAQADH